VRLRQAVRSVPRRANRLRGSFSNTLTENCPASSLAEASHGQTTLDDRRPAGSGGTDACVTGGNAGLGLQVARVLARACAQVVLACRDAGKAWHAIAEIATDMHSAQPLPGLFTYELQRRLAASYPAPTVLDQKVTNSHFGSIAAGHYARF
jgi:hypothetical protein